MNEAMTPGWPFAEVGADAEGADAAEVVVLRVLCALCVFPCFAEDFPLRVTSSTSA
jgi:hypothetical protein